MKNKRNNKKTNSIKSTKSNKINFDKLQEPNIENSYGLIKQWEEEKQDLINKNKELEQIINSCYLMQSADKLHLRVRIPNEKSAQIIQAFSISDKNIFIHFEGHDKIISILPDNAIGNNQNYPKSSKSSIVTVTSNDNDNDT